MSVLLIDAGNTNLKWAIFESGQISEVHKIALDRNNLDSMMQQCFFDCPACDLVYVSNVAGVYIAQALERFFKQERNLSLEFARSQKNFNGLDNAYFNPERLGVDRWLSMIYVSKRFIAPFCVVDSGTAVTIDAVDRYGKHLGGLILPGVQLMKTAMNSQLDAIKIEHLSEIHGLFGRDTQEAVTAGVTYSITSLIEKVCSQLQQETMEDVNCVLTGGDAERLQPHLTIDSVVESDLVLKGLAYYFGLSE